MSALEGAPSVAAALREMRIYHSVAEVRTAAETALTMVRNVLMQPKDLRMYRIKRSNPAFQRHIGRLKHSELLMQAIGFHGGGEDKGTKTNDNPLSSSLAKSITMTKNNKVGGGRADRTSRSIVMCMHLVSTGSLTYITTSPPHNYHQNLSSYPF